MAESENNYPCDKCGANLRFDPGQTQLVCFYCGNVQQIPQATSWQIPRSLSEHDLAQGLRDDLPQAAMEEVRSAHCPNCGAMIEFDGASHATECPFCATPVVVDTGAQRLIKPQALVPFQLTEEQARREMTNWLGSLWFAPSGLVDYARKGRALNGMYVPYWTFDADTRSRYRGQRGIYYYETRTVTVNVNGRPERRQEQVRRTRWYPASGNVARSFDDVLVMASTSLPQPLGDELTPWDLSKLVPYRPDYLAGFRAEGYTVALADGHQTAQTRMAQVIRGDVARDIGGDEQRIEAVETQNSNETFKHILLPIWTAAYKYNGRSFRFLVNGQTGEVQGERPWSIWKIGLVVLLVAILLGGFLYLNENGELPFDFEFDYGNY
ncbi:MAG: primosomal protein N' (replication factor Y) - superfamily II helicase [Cereibacter sphaeroides]|uniref:Primosomal protein N' (Replication factor Y)-superfamily II helicase n=1 Tax=Cereibacter sphaeroides TaxID=1063 RepID=A0A2W5SGW3_CERSP|nr:MAG: primosomal protein N' (replication factor Y) - superfamily II helicase [Cereibacter sphaeroides]